MAYRRRAERWVEEYLSLEGRRYRSDSHVPAVLRAIARYIDPELHCAYPSEATLAQEVGASDRTVRRAIPVLVNDGVIVKARRFRWNYSDTSNAYYIRPLLTGEEEALAAAHGWRIFGPRLWQMRPQILFPDMTRGGRTPAEPSDQREVSTQRKGSIKRISASGEARADIAPPTPEHGEPGLDQSRSSPGSSNLDISGDVNEPSAKELAEWYVLYREAEEIHRGARAADGEGWVPVYEAALWSWYGEGNGRNWRRPPRDCALEAELHELVLRLGSWNGWLNLPRINKFMTALWEACRWWNVPPRFMVLPVPSLLPAFDRVAAYWETVRRHYPILNEDGELYDALIFPFVGDSPREYDLPHIAKTIAWEVDWPDGSNRPAALRVLREWTDDQGRVAARRTDAQVADVAHRSEPEVVVPRKDVRAARTEPPRRGTNSDGWPWLDALVDLFRFVDEDGVPLLGVITDMTPTADGWLTVRCPKHADHTPSLRVNVRSGGVRCFGTAHCFGSDSEFGSTMNDLAAVLRDHAAGVSPSATDLTATSSPAAAGTKVTDSIARANLAAFGEERLLAPARLTERFGVSESRRGYAIPIDDRDAGVAKLIKHTEGAVKYSWVGAVTDVADLVYNLRSLDAVRGGVIFICEGPVDVWTMDAAGTGPAISFLGGAATLPSERAVSKLVAHGVREAIILYDWDTAGESGAAALERTLGAYGIDARRWHRPSVLTGRVKDINDLWRFVEGDIQRFTRVLQEAIG